MLIPTFYLIASLMYAALAAAFWRTRWRRPPLRRVLRAWERAAIEPCWRSRRFTHASALSTAVRRGELRFGFAQALSAISG